MQIEEGRTYEGRYPFIREQFEKFDHDGPCQVDGWRPGVAGEQEPPDGAVREYAHGVGHILLTVVSIHKPGKYPPRVFYVRQWRDPDGKVFGRKSLRVTTQQAFRVLALGYRHEYEIDQAGTE